MFQQINPKGRNEPGLWLCLSFSRIIPHIRDEVAKKHALGEGAAERGLPRAGTVLGRMPMQCQHAQAPSPGL